MKIHEYQAKNLLKEYKIPIPKGSVARDVHESLKIWDDMTGIPVVVKAQVHSGGRGKAGGVRVINSREELKDYASSLIGSIIYTEQTGGDGKPVDCILIEEALDIKKELYLGFTIDRSHACISMIASAEGGVEIEKVALASPDRVVVQNIDPLLGLRDFQVIRTLLKTGMHIKIVRKIGAIANALYKLFIEKDCSLAEINPLVITEKDEIVALDAKINFDDNALFRHPDIASLRDYNQENPLEVEATRYNLNYIKLKGNVGCMVNGAGLAMATMDLIKFVGAEPANFLDVGGGATSKMIEEGLKILVSDRDVKVILINIFGGILRCDTLATGVVEAAQHLNIHMPIIIRLEGTNVEEGRRILAGSNLKFTVARDMGEAAEKVAEALRIRG
ncbi:MAG TPA: ADP-forming succinate--CoA ligase subunit beta [Syntrophorhabdaceae bacterium]|nr:ADP-forming succinate--CoA ligase subunit beta [Syntrophorhabdaceae bacterium]HOL06187.1 ADP-forming succinate--CoA ligase subunit beta [Syntrophorhabdaceae bacterium]HON84782.1 ADP-forming succinate--CoA ligase subunit beta [Syntrophorhabdaceae bacterium]HOT41830.1 ADP-forming succinate--CoA ligase subunit beta [Syntrophorhabdaceae bacterium]HPC66360.1 ADP-forming succinate--CoA ligase subunit beta [Syntrophorhabdaceae bacterium]